MSGVRKAQWRTFDANFHNLYCLPYKLQQVNIYSIVDMWITIRYYDRHYEQRPEARTNLNDEMMIIRCQMSNCNSVDLHNLINARKKMVRLWKCTDLCCHCS